MLISEACQKLSTFCLTSKNGLMKLKENHNFLYQIQGQLNICNFEWCDLVVRRTNPNDICILRILRDKQLWENVMVPKLKAFYETHILPELVSPRYGTVSGIRQPPIPWFKSPHTHRPNFDATSSTSYTTTNRKRKQAQQISDCVSNKRKPPEHTFSSTSASSSHPETQDASSGQKIVDSDVLETGSVETKSSSSRRGKRDRKPKLVGRRILHKWILEGGSSKWYTGTVLSVVKGCDGDKSSVYQVYYEEDNDTYDIDSLVQDLVDGGVKFTDI